VAAPEKQAETKADPLPTLSARKAELAKLASELEARSRKLSALRLISFLGTLVAVGYGIAEGMTPARWAVIAAVGLVFLGAVIAHGLLVARETDVLVRLKLASRSIDRIGGKLPPERPGAPAAPANHPYAVDLDIFGPASVFRLIDDTHTADGTAALAAWLGGPAAPAEIAARQEAVRELASRAKFREDLAAIGAAAGTRGLSTQPIVAWAEAEGALESSTDRLLVRLAFVLVPITVTLGLLSASLGTRLPPLLHRAYIFPLVAQVLVLFLVSPKIQRELSRAASKESPFGRYRALFSRIEEEPFEAPRLVELRRRITGAEGEASASKEFASFERILGFAELRHNGIVHLLANLVLLWDVFCAAALEAFRARAGKRMRGLFAALGEIEALASLGAFAYEHPTFAFPRVEEGAPRFSAEGLGHPLIGAEKRQGNDVALPAPGTGLLVTGSNMSGKSTWLRSMGLGAVLAQAGAPVCARELSMTPLAVRTSMRISDSLEQGVSHFYAELEKLKAVVDAANEGAPVFFLLDEVLHGTNSRERHIGARAVVTHVLSKGAIGVVTSHDLALSDLEEATEGRVRNVHFEEHVADGRMSFDYKLKPGVVSTTNALRLMKLVGIAVALPAEGES